MMPNCKLKPLLDTPLKLAIMFLFLEATVEFANTLDESDCLLHCHDMTDCSGFLFRATNSECILVTASSLCASDQIPDGYEYIIRKDNCGTSSCMYLIL